jgi:hypothetical protein
MSDEPARLLSGDELAALKFAAHRQLTRWANKRELTPCQHAQRVALLRAVRILEDKALAPGCVLHVASEKYLTKENADVR